MQRVLMVSGLALAACYTAPDWRPDPEAAGGSAGDGCVAGEQIECPCTDGSKGVQRCNPDGSSYGICECSGGAGGSVGSGGDGSGGLGGAAPGSGGIVSTGGSDSGGTGGSPEPQDPRCDWIPECAPLLGPCTVTYTVQCGSVDYGSVSCGGDTERRFGWAFGDGHSVMCPAGTSDCIAEGQEASAYCAEKMAQGTGGGSGTGGAMGSGGTGGGTGETVLWSNDSATSSAGALGGIATQSYHRAVLQFTINREGLYCSVQLTTPARPTGWTGTTYFELTESQRECFRDDYSACGEPRLHLSWRSCNSSSGCTTFEGGNTRTNVFRPVCSSPDLSGNFRVKHTVRALGPGGVDETWALVTD